MPAEKSTNPVPRPRVFIGSAGERREITEAIQTNLDREAELQPWHQGFYHSGLTVLECLEKAEEFDFAIFILGADDSTRSRGKESPAPRDNVVLEMGLFIGVLGRRRVIAVCERVPDAGVKMPSDYDGVVPAQYSPPSKEGTWEAAIGSACREIRHMIKREGLRRRVPANVKRQLEVMNHNELLASENCAVLHLLKGRKAIEQATHMILHQDPGSVIQSHLYSNPVPADSDVLRKLKASELDIEALTSYTRIVGVAQEKDLEFLDRSLKYAMDNPVQVDIRALDLTEFCADIDRLPNLVVSGRAAMVSFPSRREGETFALFAQHPETATLLREWFSNFSRQVPPAHQAVELLAPLVREKRRRTRMMWACKSLSWRLVADFGNLITHITIFGSFCDGQADTGKRGDLDLLIAVRNEAGPDDIVRMIKAIDDVLGWFKSPNEEFQLDLLEGPRCREHRVAERTRQLHTLINSASSIGRWPSQVKRWRRAQHIDLHGRFRSLFADAVPAAPADYLDDNLGVRGLAKAIERGTIEFRTWHAGKREREIYEMQSHPTRLGLFCCYAIVKSTANLLDLRGEPGFYDRWRGSLSQLENSIERCYADHPLLPHYRGARELIRKWRNNEVPIERALAEEWKQHALNCLSLIEAECNREP